MKSAVRGIGTLLMIAITVGIAPAQELPENWEALPVEQFLPLASEATGNDDTAAKDVEAVRARAVELLEDKAVTDAIGVQELRDLIKVARGSFSQEARAALSKRLEVDENVEGMSFRDVSAAHTLYFMGVRGDAYPRIGWDRARNLVNAWASQQDPASYSDRQLEWMLVRFHRSSRWVRCFSVTWTGSVTAPRDGDYTFSVSPYDVNFRESDASYFRQTTNVEIDGKRVVTAGPEGWNHEGTPIRLAAGARVPVRVEFSFECSPHEKPSSGGRIPFSPMFSPSAVLFWEGPGFSRSVTPASALTPPSGEGEGLLAEYDFRFRHPESGKPEEHNFEAVIEPQINHTWSAGRNLLPLDTEVYRAAKQEYWERMTNASFLNDCAVDPDLPHPFLLTPVKAVIYSAAERAQFLTQVAEEPRLIATIPPVRARKIYDLLRPGAEDAALDFLGAWVQARADITPELAGSVEGFYLTNRADYRMLTASILWQYPEHFDELETLLETRNGGCSLPAAYTLAYAHLERGTIKDWVDQLDARLDDRSVAGDQRVSWLLARAHAAEVRGGRPSRVSRSRERLGAGKEWLVEALLVAESGQVMNRVRLEQIARSAAMRRWDEADAQAADHAESYSIANTLTDLRDAAAAVAAQELQESEAALLAELERRRQLAVARGDDDAAQRFNDLISRQGEDR